MAKASEQKLKILYLLDILEKYTDEQHPIDTNEILRRLEARGIQAERKSIYDDIAALKTGGGGREVIIFAAVCLKCRS